MSALNHNLVVFFYVSYLAYFFNEAKFFSTYKTVEHLLFSLAYKYFGVYRTLLYKVYFDLPYVCFEVLFYEIAQTGCPTFDRNDTWSKDTWWNDRWSKRHLIEATLIEWHLNITTLDGPTSNHSVDSDVSTECRSIRYLSIKCRSIKCYASLKTDASLWEKYSGTAFVYLNGEKKRNWSHLLHH